MPANAIYGNGTASMLCGPALRRGCLRRAIRDQWTSQCEFKSQPGRINFGSSGTGTPNPMGGVFLMKMTGIDMLHVRGGRLKVLGVVYTHRLKSAPDIPTIAETVPGCDNTGWWGLAAPLAAPQPIVQELNAVINKALQPPAMIRHHAAASLFALPSTRRSPFKASR